MSAGNSESIRERLKQALASSAQVATDMAQARQQVVRQASALKLTDKWHKRLLVVDDDEAFTVGLRSAAQRLASSAAKRQFSVTALNPRTPAEVISAINQARSADGRYDFGRGSWIECCDTELTLSRRRCQALRR